MLDIKGKISSAKIFIDDIEEGALKQIYSFISHPAFTNPIAIMPDTHQGKGSVIGFTMKLTNKIIPNIIGVDIGCSIESVNISNLSISLPDLDKQIRDKVPFGSDILEKSLYSSKNFPFARLNTLGKEFHRNYKSYFNVDVPYVEYSEDWLNDKLKQISMDRTRFFNSIGTLGGGNHFIETGKSDTSGFWITVHTGSRNFGTKICKYWQNVAKKDFTNNYVEKRQQQIQHIKQTYKKSEIDNEIKKLQPLQFPEDLLWLEDLNAYYYCVDMFFAQFYANLNRTTILSNIVNKILKTTINDSVTSVHNFIDFTDFIIRKGAIRSYSKERMVIPFNMRDGLLICEGKSNDEWNYSAPHGGGRVLSRSKAKQTIDLEKFRDQMSGIYSTSVTYSTLDEAPDAYKDSKVIENAIQDTATILDRIIPIHNMKDSTGSTD
jgi:RNA-splicing ligase RtcB